VATSDEVESVFAPRAGALTPAKRRRGKPRFRVISEATGYVLHTSYTKTAANKWKNKFAVGPGYKTVKI